MQKTHDSNAWLNATLEEYRMLREEIRHYVGNHRRDTQLLLGLVGGLVAFYLSRQAGNGPLAPAAAMLVPSAIFVYFLLQICNLYMCSIETRASARIERKIHAVLGGEPMDWEWHIGIPIIRSPSSPVSFATSVLMFFLLAVFIAFSVVSFRALGAWTLGVHAPQIALMAFSFGMWIRFELRVKNLEDIVESANNTSELTSGGRAHAPPGGSST